MGSFGEFAHCKRVNLRDHTGKLYGIYLVEKVVLKGDFFILSGIKELSYDGHRFSHGKTAMIAKDMVASIT